MIKIKVIGSIRGFFKHLFTIKDSRIKFVSSNTTYEVVPQFKSILSKFIKSRFFGFFGLFSTIKAEKFEENFEYLLSFNRFVNSNQPYIIYLENPTALVNYSIYALKSPFIKKKLSKRINDKKLYKIVCMSEACEDSLEEVLGIEIPRSKLFQVYPIVPVNKFTNMDQIYKKIENNKIKFLFIATGSRFYSKGGLEVIHAAKKLSEVFELELTIITNLDQINIDINQLKDFIDIKFYDFKFSFDELQEIYSNSSVLLQPSSDDSFGLTVLEALKAGLPIISSDMYAFKEMVIDGENGFLIEPSYYFFDKNNLPNPQVWNHRKNTIYSKKLNNRLAEDLEEKMKIFCSDRDKLMKMSLKSYELANSKFNESTLIEKWKSIL